MANAVSHKDMGDGTVVEYYDDGSAQRWYIDHPEWGATSSPPGTYQQYMSGGGTRTGTGSGTGNIFDDFANSKWGQALLGQQDEAAGWQREQFAQSLAVQKLSIEQQYKVAMMNAKTAQERLKIDKWKSEKDVELALLAHEMQRSSLGLDYLKTAVEYMQTPQNYWRLLDFMSGASERADVPLAIRALQEGSREAPWQEQGGQPRPRDLSELLSAFGYEGDVKFGKNLPSISPLGNTTPSISGTGSAEMAAASAAESGGGGKPATNSNWIRGSSPPSGSESAKDPRISAISGIVKALGPSMDKGWNDNDVAAINAIMDIYSSPQSVQPGDWESTSPTTKSLSLSGMNRGGGSAQLFLEKLMKSRPNLGAPTAA